MRVYVIICFCLLQTNAFSQARQKMDRSVIAQARQKTEKTIGGKKKPVQSKVKNKEENKRSAVRKVVARKSVSTYLNVSDDYLSFNSKGGYSRISVSSNSPWYISLDTYEWGHVKKDRDWVELRVDANSSQSARNDYFVLRAGTVEKRINIHQSGASVFVNTLYGTSRTYTDNAIALPPLTTSLKHWKECKCGAITSTGIGIVVYGRNGYACSKLNSQLSNQLEKCYNDNQEINSVALTSSGYYCMIYERNGWFGSVPDNMRQKLNEFNNNREDILSVSISENGDFAIVTDKHFIASNSSDMAAMNLASEKFGMILNVSITNKGICVVCSRGIYYNNIPTNLENKLKNIEFKPSFVTFTDDGTYLITDGSKGYAYWL